MPLNHNVAKCTVMKTVNDSGTHLGIEAQGSNDLLTMRTWQPKRIVHVQGPLIGQSKRCKIEMLLTVTGDR